jgi:hypothetical protein
VRTSGQLQTPVILHRGTEPRYPLTRRLGGQDGKANSTPIVRMLDVTKLNRFQIQESFHLQNVRTISAFSGKRKTLNNAVYQNFRLNVQFTIYRNNLLNKLIILQLTTLIVFATRDIVSAELLQKPNHGSAVKKALNIYVQ